MRKYYDSTASRYTEPINCHEREASSDLRFCGQPSGFQHKIRLLTHKDLGQPQDKESQESIGEIIGPYGKDEQHGKKRRKLNVSSEVPFLRPPIDAPIDEFHVQRSYIQKNWNSESCIRVNVATSVPSSESILEALALINDQHIEQFEDAEEQDERSRLAPTSSSFWASTPRFFNSQFIARPLTKESVDVSVAPTAETKLQLLRKDDIRRIFLESHAREEKKIPPDIILLPKQLVSKEKISTSNSQQLSYIEEKLPQIQREVLDQCKENILQPHQQVLQPHPEVLQLYWQLQKPQEKILRSTKEVLLHQQEEKQTQQVEQRIQQVELQSQTEVVPPRDELLQSPNDGLQNKKELVDYEDNVRQFTKPIFHPGRRLLQPQQQHKDSKEKVLQRQQGGQQIQQEILQARQGAQKLPQETPKPSKEIRQSLEEIPQFLLDIPQSLQEVPQSVQKVRQSAQEVRQSVQKVRQSVQEVPQCVQEVPQCVQERPQSLPVLPQYLQELPHSLQRISQCILKLPISLKNSHQSFEDLPQSLQKVSQSFQELSQSLPRQTPSQQHIQREQERIYQDQSDRISASMSNDNIQRPHSHTNSFASSQNIRTKLLEDVDGRRESAYDIFKLELDESDDKPSPTMTPTGSFDVTYNTVGPSVIPPTPMSSLQVLQPNSMDMSDAKVRLERKYQRIMGVMTGLQDLMSHKSASPQHEPNLLPETSSETTLIKQSDQTPRPVVFNATQSKTQLVEEPSVQQPMELREGVVPCCQHCWWRFSRTLLWLGWAVWVAMTLQSLGLIPLKLLPSLGALEVMGILELLGLLEVLLLLRGVPCLSNVPPNPRSSDCAPRLDAATMTDLESPWPHTKHD